jgi:hypothetical protein
MAFAAALSVPAMAQGDYKPVETIEGGLHRVKGAPAADVEVCFARSVAKARQQNAKSLELRAAISLARLLDDQSKRTEARNVLATVYGWFTKGFDTAGQAGARRISSRDTCARGRAQLLSGAKILVLSRLAPA